MNEQDEIIEKLRWQLRDKNNQIEDLQEEIRNLQRKLDNAEYRIKTELEPRIQREKRSYDCWVTNNERID